VTHTTRYETRNGKTHRVKGPAPAAAGKPETAEPAAAPKANGADNNHTPGKPAKEGA
jgi:hypothetical protein